jgi:multiple sugar transport system ATP-binding protein
MAALRFEHIHKTYPGGHVALRDLDLTVADGELVALVGPSGCGKSTVLRLLAGLETPTSGRMFLDDEDVTELAPQDRNIAMVFQNYALYPHKTVAENLAFGLRMRGVARRRIAERVHHVAATLGLAPYLDRKPAQLSGGQRQRVALGRAIVREPRVFLLDEPLSNLDVQLRVEMRAELVRLHRDLRVTMLHVTHDQEEAMTLGDRVAVLRDGHLQHVAPPLEVYRRPANVFVAGFFGAPAMNLLAGEIHVSGATLQFTSPVLTLDLPEVRLEAMPQRKIILGIRPHDLLIVADAETDVTGRIDLIEPRGHELIVHVVLGSGTHRQGMTIGISPDTHLRVNDQVGLHLPLQRLHFFDLESGARLPHIFRDH